MFSDIVQEVIGFLNESSHSDLIEGIKKCYMVEDEEELVCLSLPTLILRYNEGLRRVREHIEHISLLKGQQQCF